MAMASSISISLPPELIDRNRKNASFPCFLNAAEEDGEIGVFGAEKYFNGGMDDEAPLPTSVPKIDSFKKSLSEEMAAKLDTDSPAKPKIQPETPSVRSEASWNSRSSLLQGGRKIHGKSKRNGGKSFFSLCKCSCCDKTSVDVIGDSGDLKAPNPGESHRNDFKMIELRSWFKEEAGETFTFPVSKPQSGKFPSFGNRSFSFPRSKTKICEGNSKAEELQSSAYGGGVYDGASSDGSSDLFEIESLTGKSNRCLRRQNSDSTSSFTQTPCYAPSEVSIEWSVVTSSAAGFSVASDYDSDQNPAGAKPGHQTAARYSSGV